MFRRGLLYGRLKDLGGCNNGLWLGIALVHEFLHVENTVYSTRHAGVVNVRLCHCWIGPKTSDSPGDGVGSLSRRSCCFDGCIALTDRISDSRVVLYCTRTGWKPFTVL
jgi:hypothetical protein